MDRIMGSALEWSTHVREMMSSAENRIGIMPWEQAAMDALSVSVSQLRFAVAMFAAIPMAMGVRFFNNATFRHLYALITGFALVYYPFGSGIIQVVFPLAWTYSTMLLLPRACGILSWVNMLYLIWLHVINASGEAWQQGQMDFTGGSMTLVLKLISLAMCYQDSFSKQPLTSYQSSHKVDHLPSPLALLAYAFSFGNLLAGPYLEFTEYMAFIRQEGVWDRKKHPRTPFLLHGYWTAVQAVLFMCSMLYLEPRYGTAMLYMPWYKSLSLPARLFLHWPCGVVCQLRYYFVWKMSEASLVFAGLDLAGYDDKGKAQWGRCCNVRFWGVQLSEYSRAIPGHWNILTGKFLRRYVYERLTPAGKRPGFPQLLATQLVSGVWHGLYPGYLIFFASSALMLQASNGIQRLEHLLVPAGLRSSLPMRGLKVMLAGLMLDHLSMTFVLLDWKRSVEVLRSVHFIPHYFMAGMTALAFVLPAPKREQKEGKGGSRKEVGAAPAGVDISADVTPEPRVTKKTQ